jgi:hypothetical protein
LDRNNERRRRRSLLIVRKFGSFAGVATEERHRENDERD